MSLGDQISLALSPNVVPIFFNVSTGFLATISFKAVAVCPTLASILNHKGSLLKSPNAEGSSSTLYTSSIYLPTTLIPCF